MLEQLLSRDPHERATAAQAAEHAWLGGKSAAPRRRRKARLTVAIATAERAMNAVQRLQARVQPSSDLRCAAAKTTSLAKATAEAVSTVSELGQLAAMLSDIKAMGEKAKRWENSAAAEATEAVEATEAAGKGTKGKGEDVETVIYKAEQAVRTVETFAMEAEMPVAAATATVDSWEKAVRQAALA